MRIKTILVLVVITMLIPFANAWAGCCGDCTTLFNLCQQRCERLAQRGQPEPNCADNCKNNCENCQSTCTPELCFETCLGGAGGGPINPTIPPLVPPSIILGTVDNAVSVGVGSPVSAMCIAP